VTATDSLGKLLSEVTTDQAGRFRMRLPGNTPFQVVVKKVGWQPSSTELIRGAPADTMEIDLMVPAEPTEVEAVNVTAKGAANANAKSLDEARRRGWKTVMPQEIEAHREQATNFLDLMRSTGAQGVLLPAQPNDCVKSNRTRRCLAAPRLAARCADAAARRLQRGDGGVQEHLLHSVGRRRTGQGATPDTAREFARAARAARTPPGRGPRASAPGATACASRLHMSWSRGAAAVAALRPSAFAPTLGAVRPGADACAAPLPRRADPSAVAALLPEHAGPDFRG
jgi:hypothetical protein